MPSTYELVVEPVTAGQADNAKGKLGGSLTPFPSLSPLQHPAGNMDLQETPAISFSFGKIKSQC